MDIKNILNNAEKGLLPSCESCPWNPQKDSSIGFGVSCTSHGLDWKVSNKANSMIIVQDPGDTTPHETGRLCAVHNAENYSDKTAQQQLALWNAAVSLSTDEPNAGGYLKSHYWTNAIMHGASKDTGLREKTVMQKARRQCSIVLAEQMQALQPNVIIAKGKDAVNSLYEIGLLRMPWDGVRHSFDKGAYLEKQTSWKGDYDVSVFATYHTATRVVNMTLSKKYSDTTDLFIQEKLLKIEDTSSIKKFLSIYDTSDGQTNAKGMRYLLNHWLDIGQEIRRKYSK